MQMMKRCTTGWKTMDDTEDSLDTLLEAYDLKDEKRSGWQIRGVHRPESVAGHSWGVALLILLYGEEAGIDVSKALKLAVAHDLAEAWTGDFLTRADETKQNVSSEEKEERERTVWKRIADRTGKQKIRRFWEEYKERDTPEAAFVKDMDLLDSALQALKYEMEQRYDPEADNDEFDGYERMDEFFTVSESGLRTETGKRLFRRIEERYEAVKQQ